jgi:hypothetical protein
MIVDDRLLLLLMYDKENMQLKSRFGRNRCGTVAAL